MEISEVLDFLRNIDRNRIVEAKHFDEACKDRDLEKEEVYRTIRVNKVVGIEEQDEEENLYKIIYSYEHKKDLNIIIRILREKIKLITVFPSYSDRRKR